MLEICKILGVKPMQVFKFDPDGEQYRITSDGYLQFNGAFGWTPAGCSALLDVINGNRSVITNAKE